MKIGLNKRVVFLRIPNSVMSLSVWLIIFSLSMFLAGNLKAEVFKATAYCSCKKCCDKDPSDKWYGITASGKRAKWGTVAVDREVIKLGSTLKIEGFPNTIFRAEDVGSAIKGRHIDLWFPSHDEALKFGVQKKVVKLVRSG